MTSSSNTNTYPTKLQTPEFMLGMVIFFMLWAIGLVDLLTHTTSNPEYQFLGPYTLVITAIIGAYSLLLVAWFVLLVIPRSHLWFQRQIQNVQARLWLILPAFGVLGAIIWSLFRIKQWDEFPGVGLAVFCMVLLFACILLLAGWGTTGKSQWWRRVIGVPLALFLLVEGITQVVAYAGLLPPLTVNNGLYVPSGRIYQSEQGLANGQTNSDGWYFPEFRLDNGSYRVLVMGDTFVQGLQIAPEENLAARLDQMLQEDEATDDRDVEAFALGMPGFGPGVYLSETRITHAVEQFQPDELVLLFHVSNDFQLVTQPSEYELYYEVGEDGVTDVSEDSWEYRHDLQHLILHGYEPGLLPLKTLETHILSPKLLRKLFEPDTATVTPGPMDMPNVHGEVLSTRRVDSTHIDVTSYRLVDRPGRSNLLFEMDNADAREEPFAVAFGLLRQTNDFLASQGVKMRIVTIPAFPPAFFDSESTNWSAEIGPYDLFGPERALAELAATEGIDFLPMGQYMQESGLSTDDIESLYFNQGQGHFTPDGHLYFADTMYQCFYSGSPDNTCTPSIATTSN